MMREPHLGFLGCGHRRYDPRTSSASREKLLSVAIPAQHHTASASASSVSAKLGARDLLTGTLSCSFPDSHLKRKISANLEMIKS